MIVGLSLHCSRKSNIWQQGTYTCTVLQTPPKGSFWHPISSSNALFKTTVQRTAQHCQLSSFLWRNRALASEQVPLQRLNIQINLSQVLRLPPSSEWPTSSHPSDLSFSSPTNVSTRHRYTLAVCADLILVKGRDEGKLSHVQNESEFCPLYPAASFIKHARKKCDPARKKSRLPHAVADVQGKHSHRCVHQDRWLQD